MRIIIIILAVIVLIVFGVIIGEGYEELREEVEKLEKEEKKYSRR